MVITFRLVSSTDHTTPVTGATPTIQIDGSNVAGTLTERGSGYYSFTTSALSGPGPFTMTATYTGADTAIVSFYADNSDYYSPMFPYVGEFRTTSIITSDMNPNIT